MGGLVSTLGLAQELHHVGVGAGLPGVMVSVPRKAQASP